MKTTTRAIDRIVVRGHANARHHGTLSYGDVKIPCALGRSGISATKTEGDGVTPTGIWPLRRVLYRPDRISKIDTAMPLIATIETDGWCDASDDPAYNQHINLPYAASHERLWLDDSVYDIIVVLGHNDAPVVPGAGSAIFFHIATEDYSHTQGCIAISREHMLEILKGCNTSTIMDVRLLDQT